MQEINNLLSYFSVSPQKKIISFSDVHAVTAWPTTVTVICERAMIQQLYDTEKRSTMIEGFQITFAWILVCFVSSFGYSLPVQGLSKCILKNINPSNVT